jgi:drug/metabolite transporter (DMT)-like permease
MTGRDNLTGIALMTAAMAGFAVSDAALAAASGQMPTGQLILAYGAGGALCLILIARARGVPVWTRQALLPAVMLRNLCEMTGTLCVITALTTLPFVTVTAVMQAMPVA